MIGGWFLRRRHEVSLVARGAHLEAIRESRLDASSGASRKSIRCARRRNPVDFGRPERDLLCSTTDRATPPAEIPGPGLPETTVSPRRSTVCRVVLPQEGRRFEGQPVAA